MCPNIGTMQHQSVVYHIEGEFGRAKVLRIDSQGGDTPIYSVLRSSSSVKMKVKGQPPKIADSQKSNCLLAGQESTSSFT